MNKLLSFFKKNEGGEVTVTREISKIENRFEVIRIALAMLISITLIVLLVALVSDNPIVAIQNFLLGPIQSPRRIGNVVELMIPLTFTGLAITVVFKSNRFNLASDGAVYLGAMMTTIIALWSPFPPIVTIVLAMLGGLVTGIVLGLIPALVNFKFGANELVVSLMLNYVVAFFTQYLLNYQVRDINSTAIQSYPLPDGVNLGRLLAPTRIHYGIFLMVAMVFLVYLVIYRTKWGYALRMTGLNEKFAKYSGIKIAGVIILAQALGTGIAGLAGSIEMLGLYKSFVYLQSPGYGWDGIIVATLARSNPLAVPFAALFLAYIRVGADILNRASNIPPEIVSIVQGIIILLIAAKAFLAKQKQNSIIKKTQELSEKGGN